MPHPRFIHAHYLDTDRAADYYRTLGVIQEAWEDADAQGQVKSNINVPLSDPPSGVTVCILESDDEEHAELARGYSFCSALDQFSKRRGRQISEGRARKALAGHE